MQTTTLALSQNLKGGTSGAVARSFSSAGSKKDASRKGSSTRAQSVAALVLQGPHAAPATPSTPTALGATSPTSTTALVLAAAAAPVVLRISLTTAFDVQVRASVQGARWQDDASGLPEVCKAGATSSATYVANFGGRDAKGSLTIEEFEPVMFSVAHSRKSTPFVGLVGRWRYTVLSAAPWDWRENGDKPIEGKAADLELSAACLKVHIRAATPMELKRCLQLQALQEAEKGEDYDTLLAQLTKAKIAGVELEHIERAEERIRMLRKQGLHVNPGCDKDTLREAMHWGRVTSKAGSSNMEEPCSTPDCPCNAANCGEVLEIVPEAVQGILGKGTDKELFEELLDAALGVKEGSVWRAGGKFIFSAFDRNQSVIALTRMLDSFGKSHCARLMLDLVSKSEKKYGGYVTAVQVNFHPHGDTYHDQHRDIYSGKQRAGPNCTCSFRECVGTVCYSLGSSRICHLETMTDDMSAVKPCSESCCGRREQRWLHSGEAMYFNAPWNQNHTHGIPKAEEWAGPRISVAFLLGSAQNAAQSALAMS